MNRRQLEHVLRAGSSLTECHDLVVIGSQAILGSFPEASPDLLVSMEVDVYPLDAPEKADMIDGCIGELSPFHETFGYYAHGIGPGNGPFTRQLEITISARGSRRINRLVPLTGGSGCNYPANFPVFF